MSEIKKAVFVPYDGHPQIDADLHAKARTNYLNDLERERDELRAENERLERRLDEAGRKSRMPFSRNWKRIEP